MFINFFRKLFPQDFFLRVLYHKIITLSAALFYRFPARKMIVIGVTGTDGKTTTCTLIHSILKEEYDKVGLATTIRFSDGNKEYVNNTHKTTLGRFHLQKLLRNMNNNGCTHLVLEVSSHALSQGRLLGIPIDIAVITNISHEHLDYHKTLENYTEEKMKLFTKLSSTRKHLKVTKTSVCNAGDKKLCDMVKKVSVGDFRLYGLNKNDKGCFQKFKSFTFSQKIYQSAAKTEIEVCVDTSEEKEQFLFSAILHLLGDYNVENALAAISVAISLGVSNDDIKIGLKNVMTVPGRFEVVSFSNTPFSVIVDYAVTENAFEKTFMTAKSLVQKNGKLITVFGACGDRDKEKRPRLGEIASRLCDVCIVTDEEPYTENPEIIRQMIMKGIDENKVEVFELADRKKAIIKAISLAKKGDVIVITGMGDQTSMVVGDKVVDWSDRGVVREILNEK